MDVAKYNAECHKNCNVLFIAVVFQNLIVLVCVCVCTLIRMMLVFVSFLQETLSGLGKWIVFKNDYRIMYPNIGRD